MIDNKFKTSSEIRFLLWASHFCWCHFEKVLLTLPNIMSGTNWQDNANNFQSNQCIASKIAVLISLIQTCQTQYYTDDNLCRILLLLMISQLTLSYNTRLRWKVMVCTLVLWYVMHKCKIVIRFISRLPLTFCHLKPVIIQSLLVVWTFIIHTERKLLCRELNSWSSPQSYFGCFLGIPPLLHAEFNPLRCHMFRAI